MYSGHTCECLRSTASVDELGLEFSGVVLLVKETFEGKIHREALKQWVISSASLSVPEAVAGPKIGFIYHSWTYDISKSIIYKDTAAFEYSVPRENASTGQSSSFSKAGPRFRNCDYSSLVDDVGFRWRGGFWVWRVVYRVPLERVCVVW